MSLFVADADEVAFHEKFHGVLERRTAENFYFDSGKETKIS